MTLELNQVPAIKDNDWTSVRKGFQILSKKLGQDANPTFNDVTIANPSAIYNLDHDSFSGFVALEHVDHSSVFISAGIGLSGSASISNTVSLVADINSLTSDSSPDSAADFVMTYDADAATLKKVLLNDLLSGTGVSIVTALTAIASDGALEFLTTDNFLYLGREI
jgi:hypothetical protein